MTDYDFSRQVRLTTFYETEIFLHWKFIPANGDVNFLNVINKVVTEAMAVKQEKSRQKLVIWDEIVTFYLFHFKFRR